ncbi:GntR family transcriptional regulator [Demequina sp. NBRC 110052]|uniref:GntR family transcriptional regulator n=1 Tax=Demequina sp. NBRC 110052 TaxID=1570341 RepID=UPI000A05D6E6|nr:GntR family transcriptional regulator [Demequina sp. NBRC 110052]
MLIRIDPTAETDLYEQIADSVREDVAAARLVAGDRLPSAREVAQALDVNLHTVLKAYQALREEGLVEMRRGRGAVIAPMSAAVAELAADAGALVARARELGLGTEALIAAVRQAARAPRDT